MTHETENEESISRYEVDAGCNERQGEEALAIITGGVVRASAGTPMI
jgi:hypothetical protein